MKLYRFRRGDRVPTWVQRIEPRTKQKFCRFGCSVIVERFADHTAVYRRRQSKAPMIVIGGGGWVLAVGAPTIFVADPHESYGQRDI